MTQFQPRDSAYGERIAAEFRDKSAAFRWGGELVSVAPGVVEIGLDCREDLSAEPGVMRPSFVTVLLDGACALAALSLTSPGDLVGVAEYKVNFLSPLKGGRITARAEVLRPGRSITVCRADAFAEGRIAARMLATLAVSRANPNLVNSNHQPSR